MKRFLNIGSYFFHPVFIPLAGVLLYFWLTPKFFPMNIVYAKVWAVSILTVFIPIVFYFLLRNLKLVKSPDLQQLNERRIPLIFYAIIAISLTNFVFPANTFNMLYLFFSGIMYAAVLALLGIYFKYKVSLHMAGIAGLITFIFLIGLHYRLALGPFIALLVFCMGWVASSRLQTGAHTLAELIWGGVVGSVPYLILYLLAL